MKQNKIFADQLTSLLASDPKLLWPSKKDFPISVVRFNSEDIHDWKREFNYTEDVRFQDILDKQAENGGINPSFQALRDLVMSQLHVRSFVRKTDELSLYDLYILARFGTKIYVGIHTQIVQTP